MARNIASQHRNHQRFHDLLHEAERALKIASRKDYYKVCEQELVFACLRLSGVAFSSCRHVVVGEGLCIVRPVHQVLLRAMESRNAQQS